MRTWTLRTRVVVAAALAMLVGVIGLEIGVQALLARELHQQLDHTLRQREADVDEIAETLARMRFTTTLRADPVSIGTDFEVINSDGQRIGARGRPMRGSPPTALILTA